MTRKKRSRSAPKKRARARRAPVRIAKAKDQDAPADIERALALLAHEIRTPLNSIAAFSELLSAADLGEREREWAAAIKSAAQHLDLFTTLVIDSAKAKTAKLVLRRDLFRPRTLAETIAATLRARAEAKGLSAEVHIDAGLPEAVIGDQTRLRAALENLIDNAVKFTDHGAISFSVHAERKGAKHRLVFTIADQGIGMARAELRGLFRPFAQASESVSRRFGGAGLGLAFVQRVTKAMKGKLEVESEPGRGSTFRLSAVLDPPDDALAAPANTALPSPGRASRPLRVLCAEDNPYGRVVLNTILAGLGHSVDFVGTGEAAVEAASAGRYDVVLMDITLPGMDGIEATRRIRETSGAASRVPIIGLSAHAAASEESAARAAGMDGYVTKPVSAEVLARAVARE